MSNSSRRSGCVSDTAANMHPTLPGFFATRDFQYKNRPLATYVAIYKEATKCHLQHNNLACSLTESRLGRHLRRAVNLHIRDSYLWHVIVNHVTDQRADG